MKVRRIYLHSYRFSTNTGDNSTKLDIYLESKAGAHYIWTPTWNEGTRELFSQAAHASGAGRQQDIGAKPSEKPAEHPVETTGEAIDFQLLATQLANTLGHKVAYEKVDKAAKAIFDFESRTHKDSGMVYLTSQNIYDWVMTLSEQQVGNDRKMKLLKRFIGSLAPEGSPLAKLRGE